MQEKQINKLNDTSPSPSYLCNLQSTWLNVVLLLIYLSLSVMCVVTLTNDGLRVAWNACSVKR